MRIKRPIILCGYAPHGESPERYAVNRPYADALKRAGGELCMLATTQSKKGVDAIIERFDGLLLTGGGDIHPRRYGQKTATYTVRVSEERDELEFLLLAAALKRKMPILAICRGMQMVNVFMGGTLFQDILKEARKTPLEHCPKRRRDFLAHHVSVYPNTILRRIISLAKIPVNSLHHQAIRVVGQGLSQSAVAADGIIEAIEVNGYPFLVGVQWHPEELMPDPVSAKIFRAFIQAAETPIL